MHSERGQLLQNRIQRTVRTVNLSVLMTVHSFSTQYNTEHFCIMCEEIYGIIHYLLQY